MNGKVKTFGLISIAVTIGVAVFVKIRKHYINASKQADEDNKQPSSSNLEDSTVVENPPTSEESEKKDSEDTYKNGAVFFNSSLRSALRDSEMNDDDISSLFPGEHNYNQGHASLHIRFKPESQRRPQHVQILCEIPRKSFMADVPKTSHPELLNGRVNPMTEFLDLQDEGGKEFTMRMFAEAFADNSHY
jgi:hypothetical protein